jgi:hypothetical protein
MMCWLIAAVGYLLATGKKSRNPIMQELVELI